MIPVRVKRVAALRLKRAAKLGVLVRDRKCPERHVCLKCWREHERLLQVGVAVSTICLSYDREFVRQSYATEPVKSIMAWPDCPACGQDIYLHLPDFWTPLRQICNKSIWYETTLR